MQNSKLNKLRTVLSVLLLLITIFSFVYTASEASHHCTGDNCPICFVIQVVKANIALLVLTFGSAKIILHFKKAQKFSFYTTKNTQNLNTLISLKTRLND